jgi:hypothetical protein
MASVPEVIAVILACCAADSATAAPVTLAPGRCQKQPGYIAGPLVPDSATARAIFLVVEKTIRRADVKNYPLVTVVDDGDHWSVFRAAPTPNHPFGKGEVIVSIGGGQLEMDIDKCSAAISHVALGR